MFKTGVSMVSKRLADANNEEAGQYDPSIPKRYLAYLDMNNLYGHSMTQYMPRSNFRFLTEEEMQDFEVRCVSDCSPTGYILEVDLRYPAHLHSKHNDFPLAPEHATITADMLSPFMPVPTHWSPTEKLVPNLPDKERYVVHYRNLKFYLKHGMELTKIHRVLAFDQSPWLKEWIDLCTVKRQQAKSDFESNLYKLFINSLFGKTCENLRNRRNLRLIADPNKLLKAVSNVSFKSSEIINEDLTLVQLAKKTLKLDKPIYVGFTVLELSKLHMFKFRYDCLADWYGDKCSVVYTDTDSFMLDIETNDLHADMAAHADKFDTSNFPRDHPLYSNANAKVVGLMKSEVGSLQPSQFVGLRSKMYSLSTPRMNSKKQAMRAKGVKRSYMARNVKHENYLHILRTGGRDTASFCIIKSINHRLKTVRLNKVSLAAFDDKRFILQDNINSLAYGHKDIPQLLARVNN
jgi:hypothetical protein